MTQAIEQEFDLTLPAGFIEGRRTRIMEAFTDELKPVDGSSGVLVALKMPR